MGTIVFVSNADTELLALRSIWEDLPAEVPELVARAQSAVVDLEALSSDASLVIVRVLGGLRAFPELRSWASALAARQIPLLCFPGDAQVDPEMVELSSIQGGLWKTAFSYLVNGGLVNYRNLLLFVSDTILGTGCGFDAPKVIPQVGIYSQQHCGRPGAPTVAIVFYRAHLIAGNTAFVDDLARALLERGANVVSIYVYSLRGAGGESSESVASPLGLLRSVAPDTVITTVWASGSFDDATSLWESPEFETLGCPVIQGIVATSSREVWEQSDHGLRPADVAMNVAIPEFDGRIITFPFAFKEMIDDDDQFGTEIYAYRTDPERTAKLAHLAWNIASLRSLANEEKKIAIVLSAYPTKKSRLGNAVGLDSPASAILLLDRLRSAGYLVTDLPKTSDELMALLGETVDVRDPTKVGNGVDHALSLATDSYNEYLATLPLSIQEELVESHGSAPGTTYVSDSLFRFPGLRFGNVIVAIQPPRGFGENPIAIYHSPELPPSHHYLAFYHYLEEVEGVHAVIHLGKHGTLEWLPGKSVGLSALCYPDVAIGAMPVIYPFVINDPGEGTQAKRRMHATLIGHLIPPMTRADTYGHLSDLEALLDEHQRILSLDPSKLPRIREEIWALLVEAEIASELGVVSDPDFDSSDFDGFLTEVDGYLCEIKDALIRGGLHTLGEAPRGQALVDMVASICRVDHGEIVSLRTLAADALGIESSDLLGRRATDAIDELVTYELTRLSEANFDPHCVQLAPVEMIPTLEWVCSFLVPALLSTEDEMTNLLAALNGQSVPSGPSGSPTRGMSNTLPTGRNFYSLDPRAIPTRLSYEVGERLAEGLIERYRSEEGNYPTSVGVVIWGTAAIRTGGDDISQVLSLLGVRPKWDPSSQRVVGLEVIPLDQLRRPRIDVTCRISGFFRDAFPQTIALLDEAYALVEALDEPSEMNSLIASRGEARIFGPPLRAYGSGILPLLESKNWRSDDDLAEVYLTWGGYTYSHGQDGAPEREGFAARLRTLDIASKNQDNREHDIFDSDDYLQDHGGMIATARSLSGTSPKAYFGDSSRVDRPVVRSLKEEAARVIRSRVVNPKWIASMMNHGYKGAFEMAATVDYVFGYDATAQVIEDWMYEAITESYVGDEAVRKFFAASNPTALGSICERLLEADQRGLWSASPQARETLTRGLLESEGWEES